MGTSDGDAVPTVDGESSLWRSIARDVGVVLIVASYFFVVLPVAYLLLWVSGRVWGVLACVVAYLILVVPGILLAAALGRSFWSRRASISLAVVVVTAGGLLLFGLTNATAPPTIVLTERLDEIGVPAPWRLVDESVDPGANCFDVCPSVCRRYQAPGDQGAAIRSGVAWFSDAGYGLSPWGGDVQTFEGRANHQVLTISASKRSMLPAHDAFEDVVEVCLSGREVA